ncbi:sperm-associated antigen 16 protein [Betta splendens]|uniref:Sperm-associated antigen 16 protein n=1 Tax=Betta splendens TaxID=158456 RepID=A0A6P7ME29_BETSP|nr:sperm-associated antigen 16 protein [Betta splendens]
MDETEKNQEIQNGSVSNDTVGDFECKDAPLEDDWTKLDREESLETTVEAVRQPAQATVSEVRPEAGLEAVDDFLRNFLYQAGMTETLDCFQSEWAEMRDKGLVDAARFGAVPSVYAENQRLARELRRAEREREERERAAAAAARAARRVQKARDLHRMQCARVLQERNRLVEELRRLKAQCDDHEPAVRRMNEKHRALLKQTTPATLETDEAAAQSSCQSAERSALLCEDPATPTAADRPRSCTGVQ